MRVDVARRLGERDGKLEAVRGIRELERSCDANDADVELDDVRGAVLKMRQELRARGEIRADADRAADRVRDLLQSGNIPAVRRTFDPRDVELRSIVAQSADRLFGAQRCSASMISVGAAVPCWSAVRISPRRARSRSSSRPTRSFAPRRP